MAFDSGNWKIEALATEGAIEEDEGLVLPVSSVCGYSHYYNHEFTSL